MQTPVSKRLKQARISAGYSQKQLGIKAGLDEFTASPRMNQYETGKHVPNFATIAQIAKALKIPTAYFYAKENNLAEFISLWSKLSKADRDYILDYARSASKK